MSRAKRKSYGRRWGDYMAQNRAGALVTLRQYRRMSHKMRMGADGPHAKGCPTPRRAEARAARLARRREAEAARG